MPPHSASASLGHPLPLGREMACSHHTLDWRQCGSVQVSSISPTWRGWPAQQAGEGHFATGSLTMSSKPSSTSPSSARGIVGICAAAYLAEAGQQRDGHRPHRHLRGDEFRQCRRLRLLRRAAAGAQGHDAAICRNGWPIRSGRWPFRRPICRSSLPWLLRFWRAGAPTNTRRAWPRRPA